MSTLPLISQLKSLFQLCTLDVDGARKTQEQFLDAWKNHPGEEIGKIADGIPVVGHIKGLVHLAMGDKEGFVHAEEAATRTLAVLGAGALTVASGGAGAPVLAGVVAGAAAGVASDAILTGIESARHAKFDPQGTIGSGTEIVRDIQGQQKPQGAIFDTIAVVVGDALLGADGGAINAARTTTKVYRVEGESLWRETEQGVKKYDNRTSRRLFPIEGGVKATAKPSLIYEEPPTTGKQRNAGNQLYLSFGKRMHADKFYAQRLYEYHEAVEMHMQELEAGTSTAPDLVAAAHNLQIKSFRILTRDRKALVDDLAIPQQGAKRNSRNQGVLEVDPTQSDGLYQCSRLRYTPILEKAVKGTYTASSPWIRHLPPRVLKLIVDQPVKYYCVRVFVLSTAHVSGFLASQTAANAIPSNVSLWQLNADGINSIKSQDVPVAGLLQARHVKCGRELAGEPDHGEYSEYLVQFTDGTKRWCPEALVAKDLKQTFVDDALAHSKEVSQVLDTKGTRLTVQRPDGTKEDVDQTQLFWLEDEPAKQSPLAREELDAILHQTYQDHDATAATRKAAPPVTQKTAPVAKAVPAATQNNIPAATQKAAPAATQKTAPVATQKAVPAVTHNSIPAATQKAVPVATQKAAPAATHKNIPGMTQKGAPAAMHKSG